MDQFPEEPLNLTSSDGFGYFPAYPGQTLNNNKYKILRKLGYGPRSSVWLVGDPRDDHEYLAVKILTAHETLQKPSLELDALKVATNLNFYGTFEETSHHGTHLCFVLDVMGISLEILRLSSPTKSLSVSMVQRVIACVVDELEELHKCGLIHGAITERNIAFYVDTRDNILHWPAASFPTCVMDGGIMNNAVDTMTNYARVVIDGVEYPIIRSSPVSYDIKWNDPREVINRSLLILSNLGHAQKAKRKPTWEKSCMDRSLRPPEIILGQPYSFKVDVWMLGCAAYHMLTGKPLVPEEKAVHNEVMLGWLTAMCGSHIKPPDPHLKMLYYQNAIFSLEIPTETLYGQIFSNEFIKADDIPGIVKFIQSCLVFNPDNRPTLRDLRQNEWVEPGYDG